MYPPPPVIIRPIRRMDDTEVSRIVIDVMTAHGCTGKGFAIHDAEVDGMHAAYSKEGSRYYVVEREGLVLGGAGFGRLHGSTPVDATAELRKMYFREELRGRGIARSLLALLLDEMRLCGYRRCYLETTSWMHDAQRLYRAAGFEPLPGPLGCTGHGGCDAFFAREL